jgi:hypothetical protein
MRIIKKLNEGLDNSKFSDYNNALDNSPESNKGQLVVDQIEDWDPSNLTDGFQSSLQRKIVADGWDPTDYFMIWLHNTDDNNISALDEKSSEALIKVLDKDIRDTVETRDADGKLRRKTEQLNNSKYLLEDNGLFEGSSNDIIYKLNALSMIFDSSIRDQFTKLNDSGELMIQEKETGDLLHPEERQQLDDKGKPIVDKYKNPVMITVYVKSDGSEVPKDKVEAAHPSMDDMMSGDRFLATSEIKKNLNNYVKEKFKAPGEDKPFRAKKDPTKPTLYSILLKWPGVKLPKDRGIAFNNYPSDFKQFLANCLSDYYMKTLRDKDYKTKAEVALNKLGQLLNNPNKHADAFWNIMPNANKNTQDLGSAIINQFFKDPTGESKLK